MSLKVTLDRKLTAMVHFQGGEGGDVEGGTQLEPVTTVDVISGTFLHPWELEFSELYQTQGRHQLFS